MPIHKMYENDLKAGKKLGKLKNLPVFQLREFQNAGHKALSNALKIERIEKRVIVLDDWNQQIQIFYPDGADLSQKLPVVMYYHGGGFLFGQFNSIIGRTITKTSNAICVFVDYRLSPDYKFPTPLEDCYSASKYIYDNIEAIGGDKDKFCICGDSAGGSIALGVAQLAKKREEFRVHKMLLIYPLCDHSKSIKESKYNSYKECGKKYLLTAEFVHLAERSYIRDERDFTNPLIFAHNAEDFSVFPPSLIIVSEYDPLRDEGLALAKKLKDACVSVEYIVGEGMLHAFMEKFTCPEVLAIYGKVSQFINS